MERLAQNLRTLRKSSGLSLEKIIGVLGKSSRQTIYDYETGRSQPSIDRLVVLAELYNVTLDQIVYHDFEGGGGLVVNEDQAPYGGLEYNVVVLHVSGQSQLALSPTIALDRQGDRIWIPGLPALKDPLYLVVAVGGAMSPTINPGETILCAHTRIDVYQQDEPHVIVRHNNAVIIRRMRPAGDGVHTLFADNAIVPESDLRSEEVRHLFRVVYRLKIVPI